MNQERPEQRNPQRVLELLRKKRQRRRRRLHIAQGEYSGHRRGKPVLQDLRYERVPRVGAHVVAAPVGAAHQHVAGGQSYVSRRARLHVASERGHVALHGKERRGLLHHHLRLRILSRLRRVHGEPDERDGSRESE